LGLESGDLYEAIKGVMEAVKSDREMENALLKVLFVESRNEVMDPVLVMDWAWGYLGLELDARTATILLRYMKLYRAYCHEGESEYDTFEKVKEQRPLYLDQRKHEWGLRLKRMVLKFRRELFIERRKESSDRAAISHSIKPKKNIVFQMGHTKASKVHPGDDTLMSRQTMYLQNERMSTMSFELPMGTNSAPSRRVSMQSATMDPVCEIEFSCCPSLGEDNLFQGHDVTATSTQDMNSCLADDCEIDFENAMFALDILSSKE